MLLSAVSVLVVAQSSSEIPEGLMNNPVYVVRQPVYKINNCGQVGDEFLKVVNLKITNFL